MERLTQKENDRLVFVKQDNGEYIPAYWDEDNFRAIKKLADYEDIGTPEELKELKENGAFTGLELAQIAKMQKEWKVYKDAEEQGLLVRLPCKVGDTVYVQTRNFISELRITLVSVDTSDMSMYFSWMLNSGIYPNLDGFSGYELGKFVFLTREEAEKKLETISDSIQYYGVENQSTAGMEECAELIQAISKAKRGKLNKENLKEEIADVLICIEMLKQMYNISDLQIDSWIKKKQAREQERMKNDD